MESKLPRGPFNIFSMGGMVFVHAIGVIPPMWLLLIGVLRNMDARLEEAATISGAGPWRTLLTVTVPLMTPGLLAVVILFLVAGLESLETPLALGRTAGIEVLATRVYALLGRTSEGGFSYGAPAALGMGGLAIGIAGICLYLYLVRHASSYAVVTGKGYRPNVINLGPWRYVALLPIILFLLIQVVIPFSILLVTSFQRFYQPMVPGSNPIWTMNNFRDMLDFRFFGQYLVNTLTVSVAAATLTMVLVSFFAWQVVRWPSKATQLVNALAFTPLAIPALISGLAFLLLFVGTPLYGTLILLVLAFVARYLAFGTRLMHAAQLQIHQELEEAAWVGGAGYLRTFFSINLRLLIPAFLNGWLWVLTHASRDFTTPLMVATAGSQLVANQIFGRYLAGQFPISAAMMVMLVTLNITVVVACSRWIYQAVGQE